MSGSVNPGIRELFAILWKVIFEFADSQLLGNEAVGFQSP